MFATTETVPSFSVDDLEAAKRFFRGLDVVIEPRKLWVSGLAGRKGKIAGVGPGRALAFADDPAWGDVLRVLWQRDAPAPPEVLDGLVQVLVRWSASWQRPTRRRSSSSAMTSAERCSVP